MDELTEREKELDCLYNLSHLLVEFQGEESLLLEKATPLLHAALSSPGGCGVSLEIAADAGDECASVGNQILFFSRSINNREILVLSVRFYSPGEMLLDREESLLRSSLELLTEGINRMRLEKKILAKNHALSEMIEQLSEAKYERTRDMERKLYARIFPSIERLRGALPREMSASIDVVKAGIRELIGTDSRRFPAGLAHLSPREQEICGLIQSGMDTKSMAELLNVSAETIERHRCNIRKKIGLTGTGQGLHQYLINL